MLKHIWFWTFTRGLSSNHICRLLILLGTHGKCFIIIPFSRSFILEPKTKCILSIFNHIAACILRIFSTCIFVGEESSKTNVYISSFFDSKKWKKYQSISTRVNRWYFFYWSKSYIFKIEVYFIQNSNCQ